MAKKKKDNTNRNMIIGGLALFWLMGTSGKSSSGIQSKYYSIQDVQKSDTAVSENITEQFQPLNSGTIDHVNEFIKYVLDPLTLKLGEKLDIESWWRSTRLNEAVGGVDGSFHLTGGAIDADAIINGQVDNRRIVLAMYKYGFPFTEMILYGSKSNPTQIHLAYDPRFPNAKELLFKKPDGTYEKLDPNVILNQYVNVEV